jgi:NIMA (never in mitosis gene a)-related kinase
MHRDLKTQNIFLTKSKVIKVGDLGIARVLDSSTDMATTLIGTPYYMSPELFSNKPYNFKSDVWALGCCVYEMTTLKHAFNGRDMNSLMYKILRGKMPPLPSVYSVELINLIRAMLNKTAEKRPSVNRILRDPYIKKNIAIFLEETRSSSSASRSQPNANGMKERPASAPVRKPKESDASVRQKGGGKQSPKKGRKVSRPAENLEPLHIGPDLEPIKEEPTPRDSVDACLIDGPLSRAVSSGTPSHSIEVAEQQSKPFSTPRVLPPRPSSTRNPVISRV